MTAMVMAGLAALSLTSASARLPDASFASGQPVTHSLQIAQAQPGTTPYPYRPLYASPAPTGFAAYRLWLASLARRAGVRESTIQATVPGLEANSRVMQLDQAQRPEPVPTGFMAPFAPYERDHVTQSMIDRGRTRYAEYWPKLQQVELRYGVDPAVLMAIYGSETSYGTVTGGFDLLEALASLGYEGRRRSYFESEFIAALKLVDLGVPRWRLKGSYAGATGYPQFMPSVALRVRADGDGDGYADLWANEVDGLASIANYLRDAGWKPNVRWGMAVRTPASLNRYAIRSTLVPDRCPRVYQRHSRWLSVREWRSLGVVPTSGSPLADSEQATLLEPNGPGATAYLLSNNYRAILDYNCSNYYALSVGLLADAIARR